MPSRCPPFLRLKNGINVYQLENSKLMSVYQSKNWQGCHKTDPLRLLENKNSYYCLIKMISNWIHFLCRSKSKQNKGSKTRFWRNCFQPIVKSNFKNHALFCESNALLEIRMPVELPSVRFVSWEKRQNCPFVLHADLECCVDRDWESEKPDKRNWRTVCSQFWSSPHWF